MDTLLIIIEQALRAHQHSIEVGSSTTDDDVYIAIRQVMRENPDIFWFSHQWSYSQSEAIVRFRYTIDKKQCEKIRSQIDDVIEKDFRICEVLKLSIIERVLYVYKWLALYCDYNIYSVYNQTIYSVFVYRSSVCTGFAKAAQYLLQLLDVESKLVFGKIKNSEIGSRHCWLIVNILGKWYHLDPSFSSFNAQLANKAGVSDLKTFDGLNFWCFCISTKDISSYFDIEDKQLLPRCYSMSEDKVKTLQSNLGDIKFRDNLQGVLLSDKGTTSSVYSCTCDKNVVLKCVTNQDMDYVRKEFLFMDRLRDSRHTLHLIDQYCDVENGLLAIERATPIIEWMTAPMSSFRLSNLIEMVIDIANAIDECFWHSIFYRDIHLNNIYISKDGRYKLGDFGSCSFAILHEGLLVNKKIEGSPWFLAPESYNNGVFNMASATYSLSLIIYFVLNGMEPPFWKTYHCKKAYEIRCQGENISALELKYINDKDVINAINTFLTRGLAYDVEHRFRSIEEFTNALTDLHKVVDDKDFTLPCKYQEDIFGITYSPFSESSDSSSSFFNSPISNQNNILPAHIICPNCGNEYNVNVLEKLVEDMRPMLGCGSTLGGLLPCIEKETDVFECPNCAHKTTITECIAKNAISLPAVSGSDNNGVREHWHENKDFCSTEFPDFNFSGKNAYEKMPSQGSTFLPKTNIKCNYLAERSIWSRLLRNRNKPQSVYSSVFAPAEVAPKQHLMVQVYLHLPEETEAVKSLASEADKSAERRGYEPLEVPLRKGDNVEIELNVNGDILLYNCRKSVIWQGSFVKRAFDFVVPSDISVSELSCSVNVFVNGAIAGELIFLTAIVDSPRQLNTNIYAKPTRKLFISYSHKDLNSAEKIAKIHEALGIDVFFDKHRLKAGYIYSEEISRFIQNADTFVLCWSENAAKSDYVEKERQEALALAYPQSKPRERARLRIHPYNIEPYAVPPADMIKDYHFEEL